MGLRLFNALLIVISLGSVSVYAQESQELVLVDTSGTTMALEKRDGKFVPLTQMQKLQLIESIKSGLQRSGFADGEGEIVSRADHVAQMHVGEDHAMVTVAIKDSEGELQTHCVQGVEAAVELMSVSEQVQ